MGEEEETLPADLIDLTFDGEVVDEVDFSQVPLVVKSLHDYQKDFSSRNPKLYGRPVHLHRSGASWLRKEGKLAFFVALDFHCEPEGYPREDQYWVLEPKWDETAGVMQVAARVFSRVARSPVPARAPNGWMVRVEPGARQKEEINYEAHGESLPRALRAALLEIEKLSLEPMERCRKITDEQEKELADSLPAQEINPERRKKLN